LALLGEVCGIAAEALELPSLRRAYKPVAIGPHEHHRRAVGLTQIGNHVPFAYRLVAIDADIRVGHAMQRKRHLLERVDLVDNSLTALAAPAEFAGVPNAVFNEQ